VKIGERSFRYQMGSDLQRDGMFLELLENEDLDALAEVFYSDMDGSMTFTTYVKDLPLEAIERLIAEGRRRLPPTKAS